MLEAANEIHRTIDSAIALIRQHVVKSKQAVGRLGEALEELRLDNHRLEEWYRSLADLDSRLPDIAHRPISPSAILSVIAPEFGEKLLAELADALRSRETSGGVSVSQVAWDVLTRLEELLARAEAERQEVSTAEVVRRRASPVSEVFQGARDSALDRLFNEIRDRFVDLYSALHGDDEADFAAVMAPSEAGLDFRVDFHGHGVHPPAALHSEGHQDSMGICLYFALSERLTHGLIDLVVLDDVMMSVDADHRRDLCRLLASAFPDKQLIITTHDRTWAHQLRSEGVVAGGNSIQFHGWSLETGPHVSYAGDIWSEIDASLGRNAVRTAAHSLRRSSEEYFASVCDALGADVRYKLDGRYELGDFVGPAMARIRYLLKRAKRAANSWNQTEEMERLAELESTFGQVFARSNAEQWSVNVAVHYNAWEDLSVTDFRPVLEAFQDLFDVFRCATCHSLLRIATAGGSEIAIRCNCGAVDWNLAEPGK
jgi:hypothetical protein